jgi:hypothetical protein
MLGALPPEQLPPEALPPEALPPAQVPQAQVPQAQGSLPTPVEGAQIDPSQDNSRAGQGYNGVVEAFGQQVQVVDGMAEFNGEMFYVNQDGSWVVNQDQMVIGYIDNGKFVEADEAYIDMLRSKGMIEEGG